MALINKLTDLGNAVRERTGFNQKMTLDEMAMFVKAIPYPDVEETVITENGTYEPGDGVDGFSKVVVDVYIPEAEELPACEEGVFF